MRYRNKLTGFKTGEKNRALNCLTVSNIKLDDVFSDVFGKASDDQLLSAVDGEICKEQAEKLRVIRDHMSNLDLCKSNIESVILSLAENYIPQLELIMTVPGIQTSSAITIISEIGVDMSVFPTSKQLCSWAGLTPQNNDSGGKKKTTRISRAGVYIKPLLVQCVLAANCHLQHY